MLSLICTHALVHVILVLWHVLVFSLLACKPYTTLMTGVGSNSIDYFKDRRSNCGTLRIYFHHGASETVANYAMKLNKFVQGVLP